MAARTPLEILLDEACCSICLEVFQDPMFIHCGHSFCQSCITQNWEGLTTNFSCPQCRQTVSQKSLCPNRELANMIEAAKRLNVQQVREVEGGENLCEKHQEPLKLFCQDDKRLICVVCDRSKVHRDHSVAPIEEAAQEYKVRGLWACLGTKGRKKKKKRRTGEGNRLETVMQEIVTTYRKLHKFLEKQESSFLAQLEQLDTEIRNAHEESFHRLSEEMTSLGTLIGEMERTYQQPDLELLKVRAQRESLSHSLDISPELEKKFFDFREKTTAIKEALEKFQGTMRRSRHLTLSPSPAQIMLDPETANARLYLSEDCKLVWFGSHEQDLPSNPERFKVNHCVLGSRGFTSGCYQWNVEICRDGVWAIGVAKESVPRDSVLRLQPEAGIWALCHNHGGYMAHTSPAVTLLTLRSVPQQIQICLDCEEGRVVFFDALSKERIFGFTPASFQGERVFPCSPRLGSGSPAGSGPGAPSGCAGFLGGAGPTGAFSGPGFSSRTPLAQFFPVVVGASFPWGR
uniref:Zinc finger protein RFP-like n=1 Tax=Calidris pygmaea TaxID=425635 RepID=A0A8C3K3H3_9CHAR